MLADSVEASVRSLSSHEEPAIRAMVDRIIAERQDDGQFDECDLTLRDLDRIREAFVAQLLGMYHRRIEYPQNKIVELEFTTYGLGRPSTTGPSDEPGRRVEVRVGPGVTVPLPADELAAVVERALEAAGAPLDGLVGLTLSDDAELTALNERYLGHEGPTDVLSFPLLPPSVFPPHPGRAVAHDTTAPPPFVLPPGEPVHLGDIVVSVERAILQAEGGPWRPDRRCAAGRPRTSCACS